MRLDILEMFAEAQENPGVNLYSGLTYFTCRRSDREHVPARTREETLAYYRAYYYANRDQLLVKRAAYWKTASDDIKAKHRAHVAEWYRQRAAKHIAMGLCRNCKRAARPGLTTCEVCGNRRAKPGVESAKTTREKVKPR